MHKSENSLRRQIFDCVTAVRLILKNQSKKTREHFLSNKSAFIGKHESKDRQRRNWKGNSTVSLHYTVLVTRQPNNTSGYCTLSVEPDMLKDYLGSFGFDK